MFGVFTFGGLLLFSSKMVGIYVEAVKNLLLVCLICDIFYPVCYCIYKVITHIAKLMIGFKSFDGNMFRIELLQLPVKRKYVYFHKTRFIEPAYD